MRRLVRAELTVQTSPRLVCDESAWVVHWPSQRGAGCCVGIVEPEGLLVRSLWASAPPCKKTDAVSMLNGASEGDCGGGVVFGFLGGGE